MFKKKSSIDLAGLMAECEANYLRIMKLLPEMSTVDCREFAVDLINNTPIQFRMEIIERCKYTTMVEISQQPLKYSQCHQPLHNHDDQKNSVQKNSVQNNSAQKNSVQENIVQENIVQNNSAHYNNQASGDEPNKEESISVKTLQSWIASPRFSLRIYHDAQMVEVTSYNNHHRLQIKYDYPNNNMYQSNEKAQLNALLGEWLSHCLQYGRVLYNSATGAYI